MKGFSEFMTPERRVVYDKISDLDHKLQAISEGLGAEMFALASEHTETWGLMADNLWTLANDMRQLARDTYRLGVECDEATKDIQRKPCTYQEHKEAEAMLDKLIAALACTKSEEQE